MPSATEVLARARAMGIEVEVKVRDRADFRLVVRHRAGAAVDDVLSDLREVKPAVIRLLLIEESRCQGCGLEAPPVALVDEDGARTCAECAIGESAVRRAGVPMGGVQ